MWWCLHTPKIKTGLGLFLMEITFSLSLPSPPFLPHASSSFQFSLFSLWDFFFPLSHPPIWIFSFFILFSTFHSSVFWNCGFLWFCFIFIYVQCDPRGNIIFFWFLLYTQLFPMWSYGGHHFLNSLLFSEHSGPDSKFCHWCLVPGMKKISSKTVSCIFINFFPMLFPVYPPPSRSLSLSLFKVFVHLFFSNLYTQHRARTHNPRIKSHVLTASAKCPSLSLTF